jgi:hypothetical protein
MVVCWDEKPSIQARARKHPSQPAMSGGDGQLIEHEYEREGALCYLAAWDSRRARLFDRCAPKDGIVPFDELVDQFMSVEPYRSAPRVFVIADNGSAHRGQRSIDRLIGAWPNLTLVHTPVHASWLNQAEIYFSIVQRKALQPNNFADLDTLERTLLAFGRRYEQIATPFEWKFTRDDLHRVLERLDQPTPGALRLAGMTELVKVLAKTTTKPPGRRRFVALDGGRRRVRGGEREGESAEHQEAGTYHFICLIHPFMHRGGHRHAMIAAGAQACAQSPTAPG